MNYRFYKKLNKLTDKNKDVVVGTIIESKNEYEVINGEKFILAGKDNITYSNQAKKEKLNEVLDRLGKEEILNLNNPKLKEVILDNKEKIEVYLEPVSDNPRLIMFGAGHIANSVSKIASLMDFEITVIDDRDEFLNKERFPEADHLIVSKYADYLKEFEVEKNDYIVIVTRGHQFDYEVLSSVIGKNNKYVGMIGSSKKIKEVYDKLREVDNVSEDLLQTVHSPIGLAIGAQTTAEIAVAIIGEIVKVRRSKDE